MIVRGSRTMPRLIATAALMGLVWFGAGGVARADEADALADRIQAIQQKADALAKAGRDDDAQRLRQEIKQLIEATKRRAASQPADRERELAGLKDRLQALVAKERDLRENHGSEPQLAEIRERIARTERQVEDLHRHANKAPRHPDLEQVEIRIKEAGRRLQYLRVASENLKMAGEHDLARQLMEKVEQEGQKIREAKERLEHERTHNTDPRDLEIRELREHVEHLQGEIRKLREGSEHR